MKKIYFFAAALAAIAAVSSCSENELAEVNQPVVDPADAFGVTVNLPGDVTRTLDPTDVTTSTFNMFTLTGLTQNGSVALDGSLTGSYFVGSSPTESMNAIKFSLNGETTGAESKWQAEGGTFLWSNQSDDATFDFYAVSNNKDTRPSNIVKVSDMDNQTIPYPVFKYTIPKDVNQQEDLLVASKFGHTKADGNVDLTFKHALAKINLSASIDEAWIIDNGKESSGWQNITEAQDLANDYRAMIKSIKVHGLATSANFTFDGTESSVGTWGAAIDRDQYDIDNPFSFNLDLSEVALAEGSLVKSSDRRVTNKTPIASFYVIPETNANMRTVWNYQQATTLVNGVNTLKDADSKDYAYIEVDLKIFSDGDAGKKYVTREVWGSDDAEKIAAYIALMGDYNDDFAGGIIAEYFDVADFVLLDGKNLSDFQAARDAAAQTAGLQQYTKAIGPDDFSDSYPERPFMMGLDMEDFTGYDVDGDFYISESAPVENHDTQDYADMLTAAATCGTEEFWGAIPQNKWVSIIPENNNIDDYFSIINSTTYATVYIPLNLKPNLTNGIEFNRSYNLNLKLNEAAILKSGKYDNCMGLKAVSGSRMMIEFGEDE